MTDLIELCYQRHENPLKHRKTVRIPQANDPDYPCRFKVWIAKDLCLDLQDLTDVGISYLPIHSGGHPIPKFTQHPSRTNKIGWNHQYTMKDWHIHQWRESFGIQIFNGKHSGYRTDIDFEYAIIRDHPTLFSECIRRLDTLTDKPLQTITKSGGYRWTCITPDYQHPNGNEDKQYVYRYDAEGNKVTLYAEVFGEKGLTRWDGRYEIITGDICNPPVIAHEKIFDALFPLKKVIHVPRPSRSSKAHTQNKPNQPPKTTQKIDVENYDVDFSILQFTNNRSAVYPTAICPITNHKNKRALAVQFYLHDNGAINGYCHNCSNHWWVIPPNRELTIKQIREGNLSPLAIYRKPVKLQKNSRVHEEYKTLAQTAERIFQILSKKEERVVGLRADTGTGKNYQTEKYALSGEDDKGAILINVPHHDLAVDLEMRMRSKLNENRLPDSYVYRRRGLMYRWNDGKDVAKRFPYEVPCIQAPRCDAYRRKGGDMYKVICSSCQVESECIEQGYRSQPRKAEGALMVITSHPDMHINPAYSGFAKPYLKDAFGTPRLVVHDDIAIDSLYNICEVSKSQLKRWIQNWKGELLSEFATEIFRACEEEDNPYQIGAYLATLDEAQKARITFQLTHVRIQTYTDEGIPNLQEEMTLDNAVKRNYLNATSEVQIEKLPRVYPKAWTLLDQLTTFFDYYARSADAPIAYHNETLQFALPPYLHDEIGRAVFMSATLDDNLFTRAFPKAHTNNLPPTEWKDGARVYQLRTNRNPRRTVYRFVDHKPIGLSESGEKTWRLMINEIRNTPKTKHAIVTYKQVLEWKHHGESSDLDTLDNIIATAHFGGLVGLDTDFQGADVLWILFAPEIPHHTIKWIAKLLYGNDTEPLCYERDENGNYIDERLQHVWEYAVISELIQAIGRARLVRSAKKVMVLTSHFIPNVTDRTETRLFDETDLEISGSITTLDEVIGKREATEQKAAALTHENTITEFQKVYGCSERQARRLWEQAGGKENAADNDAAIQHKVHEMKVRGTPERQIALRLGISYGKVRYILTQSLH